MTILGKLNLTEVPKPPKAVYSTFQLSPFDRAKNAITASLKDQIALAKDPKFVVERTRYKNGKGEIYHSTPRSWVATRENDGTEMAYIQPRWGTSLLFGADQGFSCKPKEVGKTLNTLLQALEAGELDEVIQVKVDERAAKKKK